MSAATVDSQTAPARLGELHYHRLLVAIDGSAHSDLALAAGVTVALRDHAAITIISVAPDMAVEAGRWAWATATPQDLQTDADDNALATLQSAVDLIPEDIPVTKIFRRGKAGPQIARAATESNYDAILMGARGAGGITGLMGSVSRYVLQHAKTTVFTAHAPPEDDIEPER
jgi:nucleotide-binding universal stress UspA family protein